MVRPQHSFCPQPQQLGPHYGGPALGIWCERCGRAGHKAEMCAAREPRRFNGICGTCSERGHLSGHCLLRRDRIYFDVPTLSSPPQNSRSGRGGTGYDLPCGRHNNWGHITAARLRESGCERCGRAGHEAKMCAAREPRRFNGHCGTCSGRGHLSCHCLLRRDRIYSDVPTLSSPPQINRSGRGGTGDDSQTSPPSYSGRSGGIGCDIPRSPPQYSGSNNGYGTNGGPQQQYGRGGDGSAGYGATFAQQQQGPRPLRSFGWEQRYNGGHITAAATVQHCGRSSSQAPTPAVALAGSRGTLAAMDRR